MAVRGDEREVGLGVAAVDGEDDRRVTHGLPAGSRQPFRLCREQALDELLVQRVLPDQRMREQRLARDRRVAGDGGLRGEPLVRGDVLGQAEQLRRERLLRQRDEPARLDARRHLDHIVVGKAGERAGVAQIDFVHDCRRP